MGLLTSLHQRGTWQGPFSLKDPAFAKLFSDGYRTPSGALVNETTALAVAAFWDGVQQISADVAQLPLNLHKRLQDPQIA
jgi:phage portal protein BeeE